MLKAADPKTRLMVSLAVDACVGADEGRKLQEPRDKFLWFYFF
ncbi:MAG: hypothetical protein ACOY4Q_04375 [Bacillota bacterium]